MRCETSKNYKSHGKIIKVEKVLDIRVNYAKAINGIAQYKAKLEET